MPDLDFGVVDAEVLPFAAGPTMLFKLHIQNAVASEQIHSIMLRAQVRIEPTLRHYDPEAEARLLELFGAPHQWGETLRSLLVNGAMAVIQQTKRGHASPWLLALLARKPKKLAAVALANKMARIAWALMTRNEVSRAKGGVAFAADATA